MIIANLIANRLLSLVEERKINIGLLTFSKYNSE